MHAHTHKHTHTHTPHTHTHKRRYKHAHMPNIYLNHACVSYTCMRVDVYMMVKSCMQCECHHDCGLCMHASMDVFLYACMYVCMLPEISPGALIGQCGSFRTHRILTCKPNMKGSEFRTRALKVKKTPSPKPPPKLKPPKPDILNPKP